MDDKLLYFPSINPPINNWFKTAFLFYEQILTIAPSNFLTNKTVKDSDKERYKGYADWLREKGYMKRISSFDNYMDSEVFDKKMEPSIEYIKKNKKLFEDELKQDKTFKIYHGKFSDDLIYKLDDMNLVIKEEIPNSWPEYDYILPESIGQVFMYRLAVTLGELDYCLPSTDQRKYTFQFQEKKNPLLAKQKYMDLVMPQVFPIPFDLELEKLFGFKEKFSKELIQYRKNLKIRLQKLEDVEEGKLDNYLKKEVEELKAEIKRLEELYNDAGIDKITFSDVVNTARIAGGIGLGNPSS